MSKIVYGLLLILSFSFTPVSAEVAPESIVNIFQRLETLEKKIRVLHGDNEVLTHQLKQLKKAQKEGFLNVDERIETLSTDKKTNQAGSTNTKTDKEETVKIVDYSSANQKKSETDPKKVTKEKLKGDVEPNSPSSSTETKITPEAKQEQSSNKKRVASSYEKETYQAAFNLMKTSPSAATKAFKEYIKLQPNSPLSANSQYWIGEIMYSHNNYKGAVQEFVKVLQKYKTSDKAPDAAIKLGYSFYALKNWDYARRTFNDVLKYFPNNKNAVNLATKRLEKMKAAGH